MDENEQKKPKLKRKHSQFIEILIKNRFHVHNACKEFGIVRTTFYEWIKSVNGFREAVDSAKAYQNDVAESMLYSNVLDKNQRAIEYWLTHNCREKYGEKISLEHTGKDGGAIENKLIIEFVDTVDYEDQ